MGVGEGGNWNALRKGEKERGSDRERRARGLGKGVRGERLAKEAMEGVAGSKKEGQGDADQERERERVRGKERRR